jgi:hypothetical protein
VYDRFGKEEMPEFTYADVRNIITERVRPWFSGFYPHLVPYILDTSNESLRVPGFENTFKLPDVFNGLTIRNVETASHNNTRFEMGVGGSIQGPHTNFNWTHIAAQLMIDQNIADILSAMRFPDSVNFYPPNMVRIFPGTHSGALFTASGGTFGYFGLIVHLDHAEDLTTIHPNLFDKVFLEACWIHVRMYLYPIRKRFENLNTPFGEIVMGMVDDLASAKDELKEMSAQLREKAPASRRRKMFSI